MIQASLFRNLLALFALTIVLFVGYFLWATQWPQAEASGWTSQCALLVVDLTGPPESISANIDLTLNLWRQLTLDQRSGLGAFAMIQGQDDKRLIQRLRIPSLQNLSTEEELDKLWHQLTSLARQLPENRVGAPSSDPMIRFGPFRQAMTQTTVWLKGNLGNKQYPWNILCPSREILFVSDLPPQLPLPQRTRLEALLEEFYQEYPAQRAWFLSTADRVVAMPQQSPSVLSAARYRMLRNSEKHVLLLDLSNSLHGEGNPQVELEAQQALLEQVLTTFKQRVVHIPESYLDTYGFGSQVRSVGQLFPAAPANSLQLRQDLIEQIGPKQTNLIAVFDLLREESFRTVFLHSDGVNTVAPEDETPDWSQRYCLGSDRPSPGTRVLHLDYPPHLSAQDENLQRVRRAAHCLGYAVVDVAAR